ncbi:putative hydrolase of the HAD superfamily [Salibacterium salarium]|uniref:HAD family hydrolase n=1 Tax=Salibacterium salarium TaxID=284579 RepID=UPI0027839BE0|nr:HAD family hydrolase [Salibacterium salarium]MDQ0298483.1 putative hydrolase of the HAD superfamily [Salibacterium salarium]
MIFFDIDGTLLDHNRAEEEGFLEFLRAHRHNFPFSENESIHLWKKLSKTYFETFLSNQLTFHEQKILRMISFFHAANIDISNQAAEQKFNLYLSFYKKNWRPFQDVTPTLHRLKAKGHTLGIISNGDYDQQVEKLQDMKIIQYFDSITTSGECGISKPDKTIFKKACANTDTPCRDCYYVGDRLDTDALGSINAGMKGIWLNRGTFNITHQDVIVIHSLNELSDIRV